MLYVIIVLALLAALASYAVSTYNRLVRLRENATNGFAQIDVQLERRHDLIPNLVSTAKGFMGHEKETLEAVIQARASATQIRVEVNGDPTNTDAIERLGKSEANLGGALGRLLATAEAYPELKSNQQMNSLMEELRTTENKISFARQNYNDQVSVYQKFKKSFPPVFFANMFGFEDDAYLDLESDGKANKRDNIDVDFTNDSITG